MFKKAYQIASKFTYPLVVAIRFYDKSVEGGLGSFVVINDEGWLVTAAHNLGASFAFNEHQRLIKDYDDKVNKINGNTQLKDSQRKAAARAIKPNPKWITNFSIMFAGQTVPIEEYYIYGENDIAFIKVNKSAISGQTIFPNFIDPTSISWGTSLCKFGFPFVDVKATFDIDTNQFILPKDLFPVPIFPIDGIYTRDLLYGKTKDGSLDIKYLETSSPGLKGQSGGPICDTEGNIYAIQSQNVTLPLGFTGTIEINKKKIEENQFFNIGIGVHPTTIVELMKKHNIKFESAK